MRAIVGVVRGVGCADVSGASSGGGVGGKGEC